MIFSILGCGSSEFYSNRSDVLAFLFSELFFKVFSGFFRKI